MIGLVSNVYLSFQIDTQSVFLVLTAVFIPFHRTGIAWSVRLGFTMQSIRKFAIPLIMKLCLASNSSDEILVNQPISELT